VGFKILWVGAGPSQMILESLKRNLPKELELIVPASSNEDEIVQLARDVDVILGARVSRRVIEAAPKLKLIQARGVGVEAIDVDAAKERGVMVCNAAGINAVWVAEHAITLALALAKNIVKHNENMKKGLWRRVKSTGICDKTIGVIGVGSIGTEVIKRLRSFGAKIIGIKRHPTEKLKTSLGMAFLGGPEDLEYVLCNSDILILSVVLTPETNKMIGRKELKLMKKTAFLINISRGQIVDEEALIESLKEGWIGGAGLDVYEVEPIKSDNPLPTIENVVVTPHVGSGNYPPETVDYRMQFLIDNVMKALTGKVPNNIVDPELKYSSKAI
jgi:D-3-phosphoglycerate dehydrogenase